MAPVSFALGRLLVTRGAIQSVPREKLVELILRHSEGDWSELDADDIRANEKALVSGDRIVSAYETSAGRVFVITESEDDDQKRQVTTVMLSSEY